MKRTFENLCRTFRAGLIAGFVVLLWLPMVDSFVGLDSTVPPNENRRFARFPDFKDFRELKPFIGGLEDYFNDHFGFRKRLVTWNNEWKHELFHEAPFSSVITGRDGWLFLASYRMIEHYCGLSRLSQQDLESWQKLLEARREWLAGQGAKYVFVIAPDKHSIYPEYLPEWLKRGPQPSKLDQFVEYMRKHSTLEVLDLRPALMAAKKTNLVYSLTDTHWSAFGAFIAYQELIKAVSRQMPCSAPLPIESFESKPLVQQGDLARLAGQGLPEKKFLLTPRPQLQPLVSFRGRARPQRSWPIPDPVITECDKAVGKVIMYQDSFAESWIPYLGYHFKELIYVPRDDWDYGFMLREKPDLVIDETVERYFNTLNPTAMLEAHLQRARNAKTH